METTINKDKICDRKNEAGLGMGDEPKVELKCLNLRSSDPMKGVAPFRQQKKTIC